MTPDLPPYPAHRPSGIPWLGEIPAHWGAHRVKRVCRFMYGDSLPQDIRQSGQTAVFGSNGRVGKHHSANTQAPCLIIGRKGSFGKVNYSKVPVFAIDTTYFVDHRSTDADLRWLYYVLSWLKLDSVSKDSAVPGLGREDAYSQVLPLPPLPEQHAIARYLDHIDRRIRRYIRAKQKLIALLNEQKQAIIHQAVTRGLDPTVRLKPSGVEWLGDVPEHWEVLPLRRITLSRCDGPFGSGLKSSHYSATGVRVVRLQNIGHAEFRGDDTAFIPEEYYATLGDHSIFAGDLLIAGLGDERIPPGRACVAPDGIEPAMVKADCFRFRLNPARALPDYVALHLSATAVPSAAALSSGATRQRINLQSTSSRPLTLPPVSEQKLLVQAVRAATQPLEMAKTRLQDEISLLREYRTRLIADVVTGKVDVRAAAAALPDEAGEIEAEEAIEMEEMEEEEAGALDSAPAEEDA